MATARITHTWPDGTCIDLETQGDEVAYPDCLDELVSEVLRMYRETVLA